MFFGRAITLSLFLIFFNANTSFGNDEFRFETAI